MENLESDKLKKIKKAVEKMIKCELSGTKGKKLTPKLLNETKQRINEIIKPYVEAYSVRATPENLSISIQCDESLNPPGTDKLTCQVRIGKVDKEFTIDKFIESGNLDLD